MKKQKEKQKESGTCVAIITGSSSGKARARVGEVCGCTAIGEYEGKKYCGRHLRNLRDNSAEVAARKAEAAAKAVVRVEAAKEKAAAKVAEAKAAKEKAAAKVAEAKAAKEKAAAKAEAKAKWEKAKAQAKTCAYFIVTNDKRLSKKRGDECTYQAKYEYNGKWYCGHHINNAKRESHDEAMAEAMAEMKVESEGEDEGEDEGEPFVPFAHGLD